MEKVVGIKRASQILDLSEDRVRRLTWQGAIPCHRDDSNRRRFKLKDVKRLARQRKREGSHA